MASASKSPRSDARFQLVGSILDPAILFLLVKIGFLVG